jgi:hypothetical protein
LFTRRGAATKKKVLNRKLGSFKVNILIKLRESDPGWARFEFPG